MARPTLTVVAGANGSGKTTLTTRKSKFFSLIPVFDPDAIAKAIQADWKTSSAIAAGRQVLEHVSNHLRQKTSFAVETTLSGKNYLQTMKQAHSIGFEVLLIYIGTASVEINLSRIAKRVITGGHSVPEMDVRRRYLRSLQNLTTAIQFADHTILFDNSTEAGYEFVALIERELMIWGKSVPDWASSLRKDLSRPSRSLE